MRSVQDSTEPAAQETSPATQEALQTSGDGQQAQGIDQQSPGDGRRARRDTQQSRGSGSRMGRAAVSVLMVSTCWLGVTTTTSSYSANARPGDAVFDKTVSRTEHSPVYRARVLVAQVDQAHSGEDVTAAARTAYELLSGSEAWGGPATNREMRWIEEHVAAQKASGQDNAKDAAVLSGELMQLALRPSDNEQLSREDAARLITASVTLYSASLKAGAPPLDNDAAAVIKEALASADITDPVAALGDVVALADPSEPEQAAALWDRTGRTSAKITEAARIIAHRNPADSNQEWFEASRDLTLGLGKASGHPYAAATIGPREDYLASGTEKLASAQASLAEPLQHLAAHYHGEVRIVLMALSFQLAGYTR